jgi:hypothetical protein
MNREMLGEIEKLKSDVRWLEGALNSQAIERDRIVKETYDLRTEIERLSVFERRWKFLTQTESYSGKSPMTPVERKAYNHIWSAYANPALSGSRQREAWRQICEIAACGHNPTTGYVQPSVTWITEER